MVSPVIEATDRCRSCGNDLSAKARFCDVCGSPSLQDQRQAKRDEIRKKGACRFI
jgi:rRNA maturation endonuclease Nob1